MKNKLLTNDMLWGFLFFRLNALLYFTWLASHTAM